MASVFRSGFLGIYTDRIGAMLVSAVFADDRTNALVVMVGGEHTQKIRKLILATDNVLSVIRRKAKRFTVPNRTRCT